ncbi:hypothetical protein NLG97_g9353 [Lecanicillium saksenae]|uniref:Uncharacterized protein n=1 Tax=Lecanicillium saksenae TaxID=468837 RepID=A0ACC1QI98_9HYPO|nr:hypothetical protein NLG97_g9353 [Lecanicillium saksenae]
MSDEDPFPQHSTPFPNAGSRWQPLLLSPRSHYRQILSAGGKNSRAKRRQLDQSSVPYISPITARTDSDEVERAAERPQLRRAGGWSVAKAAAANYTYNFATDFASTDDIIESEATADCSDHEPPDADEDGDPSASKRRQEQHKSFRHNLPPPSNRRPILRLEEELTHDRAETIYESSLHAPTTEPSERLFTMSDWTSSASVATSLPPLELEEMSLEKGLIEGPTEVARQPSLLLGNTPRSVRHVDRSFTDTISTFEEPDSRERSLTPVRNSSRIQRNLEAANHARVEIGETTQMRQPSPAELFRPDEPTPPIEVMGYDEQSRYELNDSELEYTISDAILDLHDLMSKPFWADDDQWLSGIASPVPRSRVSTPYSDALINTTAQFVQIIDQIKTKTDNLEQASFTNEVSHGMTNLLTEIRIICRTIFRHTVKNQEQNSHINIKLHGETVYKLRKFVVPRFVVIISRVFTLLCNPRPEMRKFVIAVLKQVSFDMERIAAIIEFVVKSSDESDVEVKELMHALAVVREWVKGEQDASGKKAAKFIAL